jgi:hypothetical protein
MYLSISERAGTQQVFGKASNGIGAASHRYFSLKVLLNYTFDGAWSAEQNESIAAYSLAGGHKMYRGTY